MALSIDISTGKIDVGDTKFLKVHPRDSSGSDVPLATLSAEFTAPSGAETSYTIVDFAGTAPYVVPHTFDETGVWRITVTATDTDGNAEVESGAVRVR